MALSDRIRPDCEAAPWVVEEVRKIESALDGEHLRVALLETGIEEWKHKLAAADALLAEAERVGAVTAERLRMLRNVVEEAMGHLGAAQMQTIDSDDRIIADHMRDALAILTSAWRQARGA